MNKKKTTFLKVFICFSIGFTSFAFTNVKTINPVIAANQTYTDGSGYSFSATLKTSDSHLSSSGAVSFGTSGASFTGSGALATYAPYNIWTAEFDIKANAASSTTNYFDVVFGSSSSFTSSSNQKMIRFGHGGHADNVAYIAPGIGGDNTRLGWVTPYSDTSKSHHIRITASSNQVRAYMDGAILAAVSSSPVTYNNPDCYINVTHGGYLGFVTASAANITISNLTITNDDPSVKPLEIKDLTAQKSFLYDAGGSKISGFLATDGSKPKFTITSETDLLTVDQNTGKFTFTPADDSEGTYSFNYKIESGGLSKTGTLTFSQRTKTKAPLLEKHEASEVARLHIKNFDDNVMPITGWVAPRSSRNCNTQEAYNTLAESGLNIAIANEEGAATTAGVNAATYAKNAGVYYIANGSRSLAGEGSSVTREDKILHYLQNLVTTDYFKSYMNNDHFIGFMTRDEPGTDQMEYQNKYRKVLTDAGAGDYLNYCNLLPMQAGLHQLKTAEWIGGDTLPTMQEYIEKYLNVYWNTLNPKPNVLMYDNYFNTGAFPGMNTSYFQNLRAVYEVASQHDIPFWTFNLVTGHMGYRIPTEADMQFSINTSLAAGAKGIQWFCYQNPWNATQDGWFSYGGSFVDANGNKTQNFNYGKKINNQVARMDHVLMNATRLELNYLNSGIGDFTASGIATKKTSFREMKNVTSTGNLLYGCFDYNGKTAIYFVNNDLQNSLVSTAKFSSYIEANVYDTDGDYRVNGEAFTFSLEPGRGLLLELTNYEDDFDPIDASTSTVTGIEETYQYTGDEIKPVPTVTFAGETLVENEDYTLSYENNISATDNALVTIDFIDRYEGSIEKTFAIEGAFPEHNPPEPKKNLKYTGLDQELIIPGEVSDGNGTMYYSLDQEEWSTNVPKASTVGDHEVYYYVKSTNPDYIDTEVDSLTATIAKADNEYTAPTIKNGLTFTGESQELIIAGSTTGGTMKYKIGNGEYSTEVPSATAVGSYDIYYMIEPDANHVGLEETKLGTAEIDKATPTFVPPTPKTGLHYTGFEQILVNAGSTSGGTLLYKVNNGEYSTDLPSASQIGDYTVYFKVEGDDTHSGIEEQSFVVSITIGTISYVAPQPKNDLVYTGDELELITAGSATNATMKYKLGQSGEYSEEIPTAIEAGTYTIYYKAFGDSGFDDTDEFSFTVTISKSDVVFVDPVAKENLVYSGESQALVEAGQTSAGTVEYKLQNGTYSTEIPTAIDAGTYTVYYHVLGDANHNGVEEKSLVVTILPYSDITFIPPTPKENLTYTGEEQILVNPGSISPESAGTIQYKVNDGFFSEELPTATNAGTYEVTYKVINSDNYTPITGGTFNVTISKANITYTAPSAKTLTYTGHAQALVNKGTSDAGSIKYKISGGTYSSSVPTSIDAGNYIVYFKIVGNENYNDVPETSTDVTISKADPIYSAPTSKGNLIYNEDNQVLINEGTVLGGTFNYSVNDGPVTSDIPTAKECGTYNIKVSIVGDLNHNDIDVCTISVSISNGSVIIVGEPRANNVSYTGNNIPLVSGGNVINGVFKYSLNGGAFSEDIPNAIDAGTYTVTAKVFPNEGYSSSYEKNIEVVISKAAIKYNSPVGCDNLEYSGNEMMLLKEEINAEGGTVYYKVNDDGVYSINVPKAKNAGTYKVYYKILGDANHFDVIESFVTVSIAKANSIIDVTPIGETGLVYDGSSHSLLKQAGSATGGEIVYQLGGGSYSPLVPCAEVPGTYVIKYKVLGDANHLDTVNGSVTVEISKAAPNYVNEPIVKTGLIYDGTKHDLVTLGEAENGIIKYSVNGGAYSSNTPKGLNAGDYVIKYKIFGNTNYLDSEEKTLNVSISKADVTYTAPEGKTVNYSGQYVDLVVAGSVNGGEMKYSLDGVSYSSNIPTAINPGEYKVFYKIVGDDNHNDFDDQSFVTSTIKTSELIVRAPVVNSNLESYNGEEQFLLSDNGYTSVGTIYYRVNGGELTTSTLKAVDAGRYVISFVVKDGDDIIYPETTLTDVAEISKANSSFTRPTGKEGLVYSGSTYDLLESLGTTNTGVMKYSLDNGETYFEGMPTAKDAGTYKVLYKVFGDKNHDNSATYFVEVEIAKKVISPSVTHDQPYTYTGSPIIYVEPIVEKGVPCIIEAVYFNNQLFVGDIISAGVYRIDYFIGGGNYTSCEERITLTVSPSSNLSNLNVEFNQSSFPYTGYQITPVVTVKEGNKELIEGIDYTLKISNNTYVGTANVKIELISNYKGEIDKTFEITASLRSALEYYLADSKIPSDKTKLVGKDGYYVTVKNVVLTFTPEEMNEFKNNEEYSKYLKNYLSLADKNMDDKPFENDFSFLDKNTQGGCNSEISAVGYSVFALAPILVALLFVTFRRRKED